MGAASNQSNQSRRAKVGEVYHLRVSITPRCNYRCFVCDHEGNPPTTGVLQSASVGELVRLTELLVEELGASRVKLTGGEPLCHPRVDAIVKGVKAIRGVTDLSLTTNGSRLLEWAPRLKAAGLDRLNVSLWSLNRETYRSVTGVDQLDRVLEGLELVRDLGFRQVKLNFTMLRHYNVAQFRDVLDFALDRGFVLQLIELHRVESVNSKLVHEREFYSAREMEATFAGEVERTEYREDMQLRRVHHLRGGGVVEVVEVGPNACAHCTKVRLTHDGQIKPCLMRNESNVDLLGQLRAGVGDDELHALVRSVLPRRKPFFTRETKLGEESL
ncbi:MAG: GTP 3',8-cyclase MoaA [Promethearchaeota archaeon]